MFRLTIGDVSCRSRDDSNAARFIDRAVQLAGLRTEFGFGRVDVAVAVEVINRRKAWAAIAGIGHAVSRLKQLYHREAAILATENAAPLEPTLTILAPMPLSVTLKPKSAATLPARLRLVK